MKKTKKARKAKAHAHADYAVSIAQHARDVTYFATHPSVRWRVRPIVRGEMPSAPPENTHIIMVCDLKNNTWGATTMCLATIDGSEVPDDAVYGYAALTLANEWQMPFRVVYALGGRTLDE